MAWEAVEFRDRHGNLVSKEIREMLLRLIEKALRTAPDADPADLMNAASTVCANIDEVRNFSAYANRSIFRIAQRGNVAERKARARLQPLREKSRHLESPTVSSDPVERQILLGELLDTLHPLDKEIYMRHINGQSFPQIDKALSLKPRTSEYRFREAQLRTRRALSTRPPP
jgi:hypothetical protein